MYKICIILLFVFWDLASRDVEFETFSDYWPDTIYTTDKP